MGEKPISMTLGTGRERTTAKVAADMTVTLERGRMVSSEKKEGGHVILLTDPEAQYQRIVHQRYIASHGQELLVYESYSQY